MDSTAEIVVIGAGISGLATSWWLQSAGRKVTVIEAGPRAGGTIGTLQESGYLIETGPNSTLETSPLIGKLLDETGIAASRIYANPAAKNRYILRSGTLLALPLSPPAFLKTPLFSARAKLGLVRELFIGRSAPDGEESVAQFVSRRLGGEFLDYAINPFVAGVYAGDPELLSVRAAFPKLFEIEQRYGSLIRGQIKGAKERRRSGEVSKQAAPMLSFREGMQTLTDGIAARLDDLRLATRATAVARINGSGWEVGVSGPAGNETIRAEAVVIATPAAAAAQLVKPHAGIAAAALEQIPYPPVASVACAYARADVAHALDGFGFLVPKKEQRQILGTIFSSTLFPNRAPEGSVLLTTFVGGMRQPELARSDDAAIASLVQKELASLLGMRAPPQRLWVNRWERAIPQYTLGHLGRVFAIEEAERALPGLFFCANYLGGISVADCIKSSRAAAERVAEHLPKPKAHPRG
ncbi:MAG: protoporphyrinogen oxidase [Betaproteobacteria bacterium]|nr:protoporphyrinogen oxidase [Betaproteobacteria bacterium]